jgi:hypothetical protein
VANVETENSKGFTDKRRLPAAAARPGTATTAVSYNDVATLRTRLQAINGAYYTTARLDGLTKNDMVYAVRLADDAAGI